MVDIVEADVEKAALELLNILKAATDGPLIEERGVPTPALGTQQTESTSDSPSDSQPSEGNDPVALRIRSGRANQDLSSNGYRGAIAARVAGITYRQLDYWARTDLLQPSVTPLTGEKLYGVSDILLLKLVKRLLDTGISLQQIRAAIDSIRGLDQASLGRITLLSDGDSIYLAKSNDEVIDLISRGEGIFGIAVGKVQREVLEDMSEFPPQIEEARRKRLA